MSKRILLCAVVVFLLGGCAMYQPDRRAAETGEWTPSELAYALGGDDPCEGWNRAMFETNVFLFRYGVRPLGWIWGSIFPKIAIEAINNCADNLNAPGRMVSCFLQAKWESGGVVFLRFLLNSSVGVGGLWDPAEVWFDWYKRNDNFGQAFASWGIGPGPYFLLPMMSGTNPRDLTGEVFDMAFDVKSWLPYAGYVLGVNRTVSKYREFSELYNGSPDPYEMFKLYSFMTRDMQLRDWRLLRRLEAREARRGGLRPPPSAPPLPRPPGVRGNWVGLSPSPGNDPYASSLNVSRLLPRTDQSSWWIYLSPWNTDFPNRCGKWAVAGAAPNAPELEYRFWAPDKDRPDLPVVVLLPGTGTGHASNQIAALAELLRDNGFGVAVVDSALAWSFQRSGYGPVSPGYAPDDAAALDRAVRAVFADLGLRGRNPRRRIAAGLSLGGLHALWIAANANSDNFYDRFVAVNPPYNLFYAMRRMDDALAQTKHWTRDDALRRATDGLGWFAAGHSERVSPEQARFLIGLTFRVTLREMIREAQRRGAKPDPAFPPYAWSDRTALYTAMDKMNFESYMNRYLVPQYPRLSAEKLRAGCVVDAFGRAGDARIRVLHNADDFLLSPADRAALDARFARNLTWFDRGGHLGNLYLPQWRAEFLKACQP